MASEKQLQKWYSEAVKINSNPEYADAYARYRQLAKRADQRLVELEALRHEKNFAVVERYAYARALRDIKSWGGSRRFNIKPPKKLSELEAKISDIENFLSSPTSTKTGILNVYQKRADTFNERYASELDVNLTWQELATYFEHRKAIHEAIQAASKTEIRVLATMKQTEKEAGDSIQESIEVVERVAPTKVVESITKRVIQSGHTFSELLGGN